MCTNLLHASGSCGVEKCLKASNNGDTFQGWIGHDVHFLFSTIKNGSDCCWVFAHGVVEIRCLVDLNDFCAG